MRFFFFNFFLEVSNIVDTSNAKIYVGNLSYECTEDEFSEYFSDFGSIADVVLVRDKSTDRLRGFGFVTYSDSKSATAALAANGKMLRGRPMKVNIANDRNNSGYGRGKF